MFCAVISRDSVPLLRLPFLGNVQFFSCDISLVCCLKCPWSCFSYPFCFPVIVALFILLLLELFLVGFISLSLFVLYSLRDLLWTVSSMLASPLLPSFLDTRSLSIWDVRPYASSWVFLFPGSFVEVIPSFTLRMASSILRGRQPTCLSLW